MKSRISIVAAIGQNRELGKDNQLLWHIPGELPRFKHITTGHPIIMGRKTFESIGRPLPNRTNIVITRDKQYAINHKQEGMIVVDSLEEALEVSSKYSPRGEAGHVASSMQKDENIKQTTSYKLHTTDEDEVFIIGGGQIFDQALPLTDRLYLTLVHASFDADTFFPAYEDQFPKVIEKEVHTSDEYTYTFLTLQR